MAAVKTSANGSRIRRKIPNPGPLSEAEIIETYKLTEAQVARARRIVDEVRGKSTRRRQKPAAKSRALK